MKRITIFSGHYGSGKTNIAVNYALHMHSLGVETVLCDLDIVNPYFRAVDSAPELDEAGVGVICSQFANSSVDLPSLPAELYAITDDRTKSYVIDLGGDDRGAYALGRLSPDILTENNYEMLMVINKFRPLTRTPEDVLEIKNEIESACRLPFTGIVNNSNLGDITTPDDILSSVEYANEASRLCGLPIIMTTVDAKAYDALNGKIPGLFPLKLQKKPIDKIQ